MDDRLTEKAAQVARVMLAAKHPGGEFRWMSVKDVAAKAVGVSPVGVGQIVSRLEGYGWLEQHQTSRSSVRQYRFSGEGAAAAREALAALAPAPKAPANGHDRSEHPGQFVSMSELERVESPAVLAAVRRAMGWDDNNRKDRKKPTKKGT